MNRVGMTKIELLVIGLIVGLLGLMAVIAVSSARSGMRDAVRLSNVREIQAGLELYFNESNSYPKTDSYIALGESSARCLGAVGFNSVCDSGSVFLEVITSPPEGGLDELSSCETYTNSYCYAGSEIGYSVQFEIERDNALLGLTKGLNCATEEGVTEGACEAVEASLDSSSS